MGMVEFFNCLLFVIWQCRSMWFVYLCCFDFFYVVFVVVQDLDVIFVFDFVIDVFVMLQQFIEGGDVLFECFCFVVVEGVVDWYLFGDWFFVFVVIVFLVVFVVGFNYVVYLSEFGFKIDVVLMVFIFWLNLLMGYEQIMFWLCSFSEVVDYEVEFGVFIGMLVKDVVEVDVFLYVWGYIVVNDIIVWNIQFFEVQWLCCKFFDGFIFIGFFVVIVDEIVDLQDLYIWVVVDGYIVQDVSMDQMVCLVVKLIVYLLQLFILLFGMFILIGSLGGVGYLCDLQIFFCDYLIVMVGIDGIGEFIMYCWIMD